MREHTREIEKKEKERWSNVHKQLIETGHSEFKGALKTTATAYAAPSRKYTSYRRIQAWISAYNKRFSISPQKPEIICPGTVMDFCERYLPYTRSILTCRLDMAWPEFVTQLFIDINEPNKEVTQAVSSRAHGMDSSVFGILIRHQLTYDLFHPKKRGRKSKEPEWLPFARKIINNNPAISWRKLSATLLKEHGIKVSSTALHKQRAKMLKN